MALNTAANISSFVNDVFEDALFVARDNELMTSLITVFNDRTGSASRKNQEYGTATMNTVGESDDLASQTLTPTALSTLTPIEVGAQFFVTDYREESDLFVARLDAAIELGRSMAQRIETHILGNFSSLTGGTVGTAGNSMTWGLFYAALTNLKIQNAPAPYYCVLTPAQWHDLGTAVLPAGGVSQTNAPALQNEAALKFWVGRVGGVEIFVTNNISIDASDDATGAMFSRPSLALDIRRAPRLEPERDASRRGLELNISAVYAHGVWRPDFGVQIVSDSATPTS